MHHETIVRHLLGVLRVPVIKCLTRNPGVLGSSCNGFSGFFIGVSFGKPDTGETQECIANFHGHTLSAVSLINKSMKKSMSPVKVREFPEFGELHLCVIANR